MKIIIFLILTAPLLGAIFHALLGRRAPRVVVEALACASVLASFFLALTGFLAAGGESFLFTYGRWFSAGGIQAVIDVYYNPIAAAMVLMVTFVSALIHIYSVGYMRQEPGYVRYFCYLNLFVFFMLVIVLADNLIFLFLGWEGVGFTSYALIGFWYREEKNAVAGRKAFLLTRIGDVAFGVALGFILMTFGDFSLSRLQAGAQTISGEMATLLSLLFLWAAVGKSAQLPLTVWLPDAMAGPSPVSALIHAATMVTAGVYLLMRVFPLLAFSPTAQMVVTTVGIVTAFYGAISALVQNNIKRVLAYSTISHLGFMFLAVGIGDISGGMFYLLSHAFSKSLLFLGAGCIIQALHEKEDIFRMGKSVRRHMPLLFFLFLAGTLSLADIPPATGFFSRDHILTSLFLKGTPYHLVVWSAAILTGILGVLSTFRLFFIVFSGHQPESVRTEEMAPIPGLMVWVLLPLALLSLLFGFINLPPMLSGQQWLSDFLLSPVQLHETQMSHSLEWKLAAADGILALTSVVFAFFLFGPNDYLRRRKPVMLQAGLNMLLQQGFYLDRLYTALIVAPYRKLAGLLWRQVDEGGVDRVILGYGSIFAYISFGIRLWTTGKISTYLKMMLLGMTVILGILFLEVLTG